MQGQSQIIGDRADARAWYATVWRWHFYAGLLCVPMIVWLACTGAIYLWKPQIEAVLDRPFDRLVMAGRPAPAVDQVRAAERAVPGATFVRYQLPAEPDDAVRIIFAQGGDAVRVYVHPRTLEILKTVAEDDRAMNVVSALHGTLLLGDRGSWFVELAACWAIVMILTGLYLWWPRGRAGTGGVLYPRLGGGRRVFWRDLHAVTGVWVSAFALTLLATGLPWANAWGAYLKEVRAYTATADGPQDWTTSRREQRAQAAGDEHAGHDMSAAGIASGLGALDLVVAAAAQQRLAGPVMIAPPKTPGGAWTAASDSANRPVRATIEIDGATGEVIGRRDFADRHWIDRAVNFGIALHEGQLFGLANQIIGLFTAIGLVLLAISSTILWWRRRPDGVLGAPLPQGRPRFGAVLIALIVVLGVLLPFFAVSLVLMLLVERLALRRMPGVSRWLGLRVQLPHSAGHG